MRIGGWLRLWIVLGVAWGVAVAFLAYDSRPRIENVRDAWVSDGLGLIAGRISEEEDAVIAPWDVAKKLGNSTTDGTLAYFEMVETKPKQSHLIFRDELISINNKHRQRLAEIESGWPLYVAWSVVAWLGPLLLILALGYSLNWIRRGFRPQVTN